MKTRIRYDVIAGWPVVRLESRALQVTVVPGKGGDIISAVHRPENTELLWQSRWGLRPRGTMTQPGSSEAAITEAYAGGWQTVFPIGGDPSFENGVEWGFHGEAWITPFEVTEERTSGIVLTGRLVRSPFLIYKTITLTESTLRVEETVTNEGGEPVEVMWGQHPAFSAPLIGPETRISSSATLVEHDILNSQYPHRPAPRPWPAYENPDGQVLDLSSPVAPKAGETRMAFLTAFEDEAWVTIDNPKLDLSVQLAWDSHAYPFAWYWHEAGGRRGFPWYSNAYVLAIEPNSSWPARGLAAVRETTGTQIMIQPGETRSATVTMAVGPSSRNVTVRQEPARVHSRS